MKSPVRVDHFHCRYKVADPITHLETQAEIEGGITQADVDEVVNMTAEDFREWEQKKALGWGMPANAQIIRFWYAG